MSIAGLEFFIRFGIQAIALVILLKYTFFRYSNDRESLFSFMLFGHGVFIVTGLLHNVDLSMGFAFGLFAVFSMLRYRTESIPVHNMTYLFLVIVISLVSSVGPVSYMELVAINGLVCALAWVCETQVLAVRQDVATLTYKNMDNLKPENHALLLADLHELTGLDIERVEVLDRNYKTKTAKLRAFYQPLHLGTNPSLLSKLKAERAEAAKRQPTEVNFSTIPDAN